MRRRHLLSGWRVVVHCSIRNVDDFGLACRRLGWGGERSVESGGGRVGMEGQGREGESSHTENLLGIFSKRASKAEP